MIFERFSKISADKYRIVLLALILVIITSMAVSIALYLLYRTHIADERSRLLTTAQSQARLIEAVAQFDKEHAATFPDNHPEGSRLGTLSQIIQAHEDYKGFGITGEFTLAEQQGNQIVFLFRHHLAEVDIPPSIPFESELAEPMRRALLGNSGTVVGLDYRGIKVLAAHEPVAVLNMGIVAKIDFREVIAPFIKTAITTGLYMIVLILLGVMLFIRISNPLIKHLISSETSLQEEVIIRKKAEEDLKKHRNQLEDTVKTRTTELETRVTEVEMLNRGMVNLAEDMQIMNTNLESTTYRLSEANMDLESFSYSVSHDLRTPLRAIASFSKILVADYSASLDEEGHRIVMVIIDNAKRMGKLIDDILVLSRLGRKAMKIQTIDMNKVVHDIQREIMVKPADRIIHWQIKKLPSIRADLTLIKQVFINLITNAVKFTQTRQTTRIEVGSKTENDELIFYVKDNGVGFDMQYVDKIFEVFQRLHSDEEFKGTGVGLAIVKRIVQRHDGRIWAAAEVDKGATLFITLPQKGDNQ